MTTKILVLDRFADAYARALTSRFSGIEVHKAATAADMLPLAIVNEIEDLYVAAAERRSSRVAAGRG